MELTIIVQQKIYEIRGQKVMLDFDLAEMYGMETKYLKRSVKSNIKRFPSDFMFELTKDEWESLRCNFCTSNKRGGVRYMPFAFTDQNDINEDTRMQLELINQTLAEMQVQRQQAEKPRNKIGFK